MCCHVAKADDRAERSARIRVQDVLADALRKCVGELQGHKSSVEGWEGDMPLKVNESLIMRDADQKAHSQMSNLPQHIQLLVSSHTILCSPANVQLNLATPPTPSTQSFAYSYLHRLPRTGPTTDEMLFNEIMAEPFTGTHWGKGYDEEVLEGWTDSSSEDDEQSSTGSEEDIVTPALERASHRREEQRREADVRLKAGEARLAAAEEALKGLEQSFWVTGGVELESMQEGLSGWRELNVGELSGSQVTRQR
jgi:gamma-tubulin complex component 5